VWSGELVLLWFFSVLLWVKLCVVGSRETPKILLEENPSVASCWDGLDFMDS
jgi:hypothetical protein